ncbi:acyl-CoA-binding protein [Aquella oligotrophica]|uniref:Acyl-CoA-binding protein n=1 Tax=Aquella oligotrophica TaxID=2067065 RepID=A0A2I7N8I4_9NEIS|nr:acyl-CoA-binding protein [Aquella oligotrophica]AUR52767.1 acyl-CoA-binding protein [Aquella oligotrophica]
MSELEQQFIEMVEAVKNATINFQPNNIEKLKLYAFYKQATIGDIQGECPSVMNMVERAKWNAWNAIKGWSKEKAMQAYIDILKDK